MNRKALLLILVPQLVAAQTFDLVCVDKQGASVSFFVDIEKNIVKVGPIPAKNVTIDGNYINFTLSLSEGAWFHSINRSTGTLSIQSPQRQIVSPYICDRAAKKF